MLEEYLCCGCRYFNEFYIKKNTGFYRFRVGICMAAFSMRDKRKRDVPYVKTCADFLPKEEKIAERRESIVNFLIENAERLREIAQILEEDRNYLKGKPNE